AIDGKPNTGWSIAAHETNNRVNHEAVFILKTPLTSNASAKLLANLKQESQRSQHLLGKFRFSYSTAPRELLQKWAEIPANARGLLSAPADKMTDAQKKQLATYYRSIDPGLNKVRSQIAEFRKQEPKNIPTTLVMEAVDTQRTNNILL